MSESPDIEILIATEYLEGESEPDTQRYLFAYTITITNRGESTIKLLDRYWKITDSNNKVQEVHGEGVVGKQPEIPAGKSFRYTSGTMIATKVGTMEGYYGMIGENGQLFKAPIPIFTLADPGVLH